MAEKKLTFNTCTYDYIEEWCTRNNQTEWLKETCEKTTTCEVYPRKKVPAVDKKTGQTKINPKTGNIVMTTVADKTQLPSYEVRPITFVELKYAFFEKFMPEFLPKEAKPKKPTFHDRAKNL